METKENKNTLKRLADKLFGGIDMTWPKVIIFAAGAAAATALFLLIPVFRNTSFERMGVYVEAWILFAVIIMSNCKKPLESALKTFVFFLVSQPLIYLFQVPFNSRGWAVFGYYKHWFILTLLTFPAAFAGWYIRKKNWLSLLILAPVLIFLAYTGFDTLRFTTAHFPRLLVTGLFCIAQVLMYVLAFTSDKWQKLAGLLVPLAAVTVIAAFAPNTEINGTNFLPDDPVLTESAYVVTEGSGTAEITIAGTGEDSMVSIHGTGFGATDFTIIDGDSEYRYTVEIYEDDGGHTQIKITER